MSALNLNVHTAIINFIKQYSGQIVYIPSGPIRILDVDREPIRKLYREAFPTRTFDLGSYAFPNTSFPPFIIAIDQFCKRTAPERLTLYKDLINNLPTMGVAVFAEPLLSTTFDENVRTPYLNTIEVDGGSGNPPRHRHFYGPYELQEELKWFQSIPSIIQTSFTGACGKVLVMLQRRPVQLQ